MSTTVVSGLSTGRARAHSAEEYPTGLPVLVVDDEADVRTVISRSLKKFRVPVAEAETLDEARAMFAAGDQFSMVFLDRVLPDGDGVEFFIRELSVSHPELAVTIFTGQGSVANQDEALKAGAFWYVPKPCEIEEIRYVVLRKYPGLARPSESGYPAGPVIDGTVGEDGEGTRRKEVELIGDSGVMIRVMNNVREISAMSRPVLITGESGTGKEVIAKRIHKMSSRAARKFVSQNCGAIPEELIESTLFGHVRGSFTSAVADRKGLFEDADKGTIFLDEITETTPAFQVKLLRVLQENCITKVGSNQEIALDVRVIAASNRNVKDEVSAGRFRQDLYFRLKGSEIVLPALVDRREDIMPLTEYFAKRAARKGKKKIRFSVGVVAALKAYDWPGNVRELESEIDSAVQRCNGTVLLSDLSANLRVLRGEIKDGEQSLIGAWQELRPMSVVEDEYQLEVIRRCGGNLTEAAKVLGFTRSYFGKKCREKGWV